MVNWTTFCVCLSMVVALVQPRAVKEAVHELMSDEEVEKVFGTSRSGVPVYDVTHPVKLDHHGDFLSHEVSHSNDDVKGKRNLYLQFPAFDEMYHLKVSSNADQLLAPDFITEVRNNGRSRYETSFDDCHYVGHVVTQEGPGAKVALSNCDGLTGVINDKRGLLMIKPLPNRLRAHKRSHVVYQRSHGDVRTIGRELGLDVVRPAPLLDENSQESDASDPASTKYYIESLVVVDKKMVDYHGRQKIKSYVMTLLNIVQSLMKGGSLGVDIGYVLKKLMVLETDEDRLTINSNAKETLSSFCQWVKGQKSSQLQFDSAALITKFGLCANSYDPQSSSCATLLGLADLGGMCGTDSSCVLNTDSGLSTAFTITHETGHSLGAEHDSENNQCSDGLNIMSKKAGGKRTAFDWSTCSADYIATFLRSSKSKCLRNNPGQRVPVPTGLPGLDFSLDDQCRLMGKGFTGFCKDKLKIACVTLWCTKSDMCETNSEPAAEGSNCGPRMWCRRGFCVAMGSEGPKAIDGGFSAWKNWGKCSHKCGGGVQVRSRECDNPRPKHGGKPCQGKSKEYKYCVTKKCPPSVANPRMTACISKRNQKFDGNKLYDWVYNPKTPVSNGERCKLVCEAPAGNGMTASNFGPVQNGLWCIGDGPKGVCIDGVCQKLGCDNVIGSPAKADRCGVCQGDGSTCHVVSKTFNKVPDNNYDSPQYQVIATIPKGARNIEIKEIDPSKNVLALKTAANKNLFNMDFTITSEIKEKFNGAGTRFSYKNDNGKETLTAPGPLTEAVKVMFLIDNDSWYTLYKVTYKYTMAGSASRDANQSPVGKYKWMTRSKGCSEKCGGGKAIVTFECVRTDNGSPVSRDLCDDVPPEVESTECNTHACPPRWNTEPWGHCSKSCNDGSPGQQLREVTCVMTSAGEDELIDDTDCKDPKPATVKTCSKNACPAEWVTVKTSPCSVTCGTGVNHMTVICQKTDTNGHKTKVAEKECKGDKPPAKLSCNTDIPCPA